MPDVVFTVDQASRCATKRYPATTGGTPTSRSPRWCGRAQTIRVECREWTDGQIGNNDSANDVRDVDLTHAHMLSGPIGVEGAEPGDLLVVDILDLGPVQAPQEYGDAPGQGWGYTGVFAKVNGGGFLTDYFPDAYKAIWDFQGQVATSRHIPGVRYTGITHPGLFGTAPSADLLARWNRRERALIATDPDRVPALALPPLEQSTLAGTASGDVASGIARDGARTVPARENGGNHDIKNFTRGSRVFYPVHVDGAKLSGGDLHFSQGDGEITFCGAIEMGGFIDFHVDLIKGGMETYGVDHQPDLHAGQRRAAVLGVPHVHRDLRRPPRRHQPLPRRHAGLPQRLPQRRRVPQEVRVLGRAGLPAARLGADRGPHQRCRRHPERLRSLYLPTAIFDFDVKPSASGPVRADRGQCAVTS